MTGAPPWPYSRLPRLPAAAAADAEGLVCWLDQLTPEIVLAAYTQGMFPWTDQPVGLFSPDPRAIITPASLHLPSNLRRLCRKAAFAASCDEAFYAVMQHCAAAHTPSWITPNFLRIYHLLHTWGYAHSVEVWQNDRLVGGLYGVHLGGLFAAESMFHLEANASKAAFAVAWRVCRNLGVQLFDVQVMNDFTRTLGAIDVPREVYLQALSLAYPQPLELAAPVRWPQLLPECFSGT